MNIKEIEKQLAVLHEMMEEYALEKAKADSTFPLNWNSDIKNAINSFVKEELKYLVGRATAYKLHSK